MLFEGPVHFIGFRSSYSDCQFLVDEGLVVEHYYENDIDVVESFTATAEEDQNFILQVSHLLDISKRRNS